MSKARARERAKARKGKKRVPKVELPGQQFDAGKFNPEGSTIKGPTSSGAKSFATAKRGSARSG
jgi:hypothetical protein